MGRIGWIIRAATEGGRRRCSIQVVTIRFPYIQIAVMVRVRGWSAGHKGAEGQTNVGCERYMKRIIGVILLEEDVERRVIPARPGRSREWFGKRARTVRGGYIKVVNITGLAITSDGGEFSRQ